MRSTIIKSKNSESKYGRNNFRELEWERDIDRTVEDHIQKILRMENITKK